MLSITTTEETPELRFFILTFINRHNSSKTVELIADTDEAGKARMVEVLKQGRKDHIVTSQAVRFTLVDVDGDGDWTWLNDDELHEFRDNYTDDDF